MLDELIDVFLFKLNGEKGLYHDLTVHERGSKSIATLLHVAYVTTDDIHRDRILLTFSSSLLQGITDGSNFSKDTLDDTLCYCRK